MEDITKRLRGKKNNAKRLITNTTTDARERDFLLKVIDNAFADIVRGSVVYLTTKNESAQLLSKESIVAMSDTLTDILNNFYVIETYLDYRQASDKNRIASAKRAAGERSLEAFVPPPTPDLAPQAEAENGGGIGALLQEQLPKLTAKFNELAEALDNFSAGGGRGDGADVNVPRPRRSPTSARPAGRKPSLFNRLAGMWNRAPLGGMVGVAAMGYLGLRALTGGFGKADGGGGGGGGGGGDAGAPLALGPGSYATADVSKAKGDWKNDKEFLKAVDDLARKRNIDANDLLGIMYSESGMLPNRVGSNGATGLIQWIPKYAKAITGYTTDQIGKMSRAQQVALVDKTLTAAGLPSGANGAQIYAAIFLPSIAKKAGWQGVLTRKDDPDTFYESNYQLDTVAPIGEISMEDLAARVSKKRQEAGLPAATTFARGEMMPGLAGTGSFSKPLPGGLGVTVEGGKYRANRGYGAHQGLDFAAPAGTPVLAAQAGKVTRAGMSNARGGIRVEILHDAKSGLSTKYMHLDPEVPVKAGQMVSQGQVIGYIGLTGLKTTGSGSGDHVHVEVLVNGENVDPTPYFRGAGAITPTTSDGYRLSQAPNKPVPGAPAAARATGPKIDPSWTKALQKRSTLPPPPANNGKQQSSKPNLNPAQQYRRHFGT